ncbi:MAG: hypothetical protein R3C61_20805 [Bacteroidia bacterium]
MKNEKPHIPTITQPADDLQLFLNAESGQHFPVPVEGSLGLLAMGYIGLMAWREVRQQYSKKVIGTYSTTITQTRNEG